MSTRLSLVRTPWKAALAALIAVGGVSPALAEGDGSPARYASLPAEAGDAIATASLPDTARSGLKSPAGFAAAVDGGSILLREGTPTRCLPEPLAGVLADLADRFGPVSIQSTHRSSGYNRRAGGARHSLHLACRAVDFRIKSRTRGVMAFLRSRPEVGGLKVYGNGIIHIDNGERRTW